MLALEPESRSVEGLRAALEIAALLRLEIVALLVEDDRAYRAAGYDFAAAVDLSAPSPRRFDAAVLDAAFARWARRAERLLAEAARETHLTVSVERLRCEQTSVIEARLSEQDLLAVLEPSSSSGRALDRLAALARGPRAALAVPAQPRGAAGAVVVLEGREAAAPARSFGERVASAAGAALEIWRPGSEAAAGPASRAEFVDLARLQNEAAARARLRDHVRLLVVGAGAEREPAAAAILRLAARTGTPIVTLSAEPPGGPQ